MSVSNIAQVNIELDSIRGVSGALSTPVIFHRFTSGQQAVIGSDRVLTLTPQDWESRADALQIDASDPFRGAMRALFGQTRRPLEAVVVSASDPVAEVRTITVGGTTDGVTSLTVDGTTVTFTASGNTQTEIRDGIRAAIDASPPIVAAWTPADSGANAITLTRQTAGVNGAVSISSPADEVTLATTVAAVGYADDGALWATSGVAGYFFLETERNLARSRELAKYVATREAVAVLATASPDAYGSATDDLASLAKALNEDRTMSVFAEAATDFPDFAIVGKQCTKVPGSTTWANQELRGIPSFIPTNRSTLVGKYYSFNEKFPSVDGAPSAFMGSQMGSGRWMDTIHARDAFARDLRSSYFYAFRDAERISYRQPGVDILENVLRAAVQRSDDNGFLDSSTLEIEALSVKNIDPAVRGTRVYPGFSFGVESQGSIHSLTINGRVSN